MRFMAFYKPGEESDTPPSEQQIAQMGELIREMTAAGVLITTGGLQSSAHGFRVSISDGRFTTTDGPFAETKELIAGYAILDVASQAEAISWTKRFLDVMKVGESEVRPMYEPQSGCASAEGKDHAYQKATAKS